METIRLGVVYCAIIISADGAHHRGIDMISIYIRRTLENGDDISLCCAVYFAWQAIYQTSNISCTPSSRGYIDRLVYLYIYLDPGDYTYYANTLSRNKSSARISFNMYMS